MTLPGLMLDIADLPSITPAYLIICNDSAEKMFAISSLIKYIENIVGTI